MGLRKIALHSAKWSSTSTAYSSAIQVFKIAILARLLTKEDFGLFAIISTVLGLAAFFAEAGMSSAIVHRQNPTKDDLGSAYIINLILGIVVFIAIYFLAWPVSSFFDEPRLIPLLHLSSLIFLIQPFGQQFSALLQKNLLFKHIALVEITSGTVGLMVAIGYALNHYGIKALIYSQIIAILIKTLSVLIIGIRKFGFHINFKLQSAKFFLRFGGFQIGENSINYFNTQIDTILIGKLLEPQTLGAYYLAKQLAFKPLYLINPIFTQVAFPIFSKVQNEIETLKRGYLKMVQYLAIMFCFIYFTLSVFSREVVEIFLGTNWEESILPLSILSFY